MTKNALFAAVGTLCAWTVPASATPTQYSSLQGLSAVSGTLTSKGFPIVNKYTDVSPFNIGPFYFGYGTLFNDNVYGGGISYFAQASVPITLTFSSAVTDVGFVLGANTGNSTIVTFVNGVQQANATTGQSPFSTIFIGFDDPTGIKSISFSRENRGELDVVSVSALPALFVPEPSGYSLVLIGIGGLALLRLFSIHKNNGSLI